MAIKARLQARTSHEHEYLGDRSRGRGAVLCATSKSLPGPFRFSVFDKAGQVGGTWVYSERTELDEYGLPVHSSMYQGLK